MVSLPAFFEELRNAIQGVQDKGIVTQADVLAQHVLAALFVALTLFVLGIAAGSRARATEAGDIVPDAKFSIGNLIEYCLESLYNTMRGLIGDDCGRYFPLIGSLALFIFFSNILGPRPWILATDRKLEHHLRLRNRCILLLQLPWSACERDGAYHTHPQSSWYMVGMVPDASAWANRNCQSPRSTVLTWCSSRDEHGWRPRGIGRIYWNGSMVGANSILLSRAIGLYHSDIRLRTTEHDLHRALGSRPSPWA